MSRSFESEIEKIASKAPQDQFKDSFNPDDKNGFWIAQRKENQKVKFKMATELSKMGLNIEAIGRILDIEAKVLSEFIYETINANVDQRGRNGD